MGDERHHRYRILWRVEMCCRVVGSGSGGEGELVGKEGETELLLEEGWQVYGIWSRLEERSARVWERGAGGFCRLALLADKIWLRPGRMVPRRESTRVALLGENDPLLSHLAIATYGLRMLKWSLKSCYTPGQ